METQVEALSRVELLIYRLMEEDYSAADRLSRERGYLHVLDAPARWARGEAVPGALKPC